MSATDHLGNEYRSASTMCRHYGIDVNTYKIRISHGWSVEDALTKKTNSCWRIEDHLGNTFRSLTEMCDHYGISQSSYYRRIKAGWSLEATLTTKAGIGGSEEITDHTGQTFPSVKAMCRHWNIPYSTYQNRIQKFNMPMEEALTTPTKTQLTIGKDCQDHLGNHYDSVATMCCKYGIPRNVYYNRLKKQHWSLAKTLTEPLSNKNGLRKPIYDHKKNKFSTVAEMCSHYGLNYGLYKSRICRGWSLKKTLETPPDNLEMGKHECIDHKGNVFNSQAEMCRHYGISKSQLRSRIELGWTLQRILEQPGKIPHKHKCKDHLGNEFDSQSEMLAHYGVAGTIFKRRLNVMGLSLEEALTPGSLHEKKCTDPLGHSFQSELQLREYWHIEGSSYFHWLKKYNNDYRYCIIMPMHGRKINGYEIIREIENEYYEVTKENKIYVMSLDQLCLERHEELYPNTETQEVI